MRWPPWWGRTCTRRCRGLKNTEGRSVLRPSVHSAPRRSGIEWRAVALVAARVALGVGNGHRHRDAAARDLWREGTQPAEASRIDPPGALLPEKGIAAVVEQLGDEGRIRARDSDRGRGELSRVGSDLVQVVDGLYLAARKPLGLGIEQNQLLVSDDRDLVRGIGFARGEVHLELERAGDRNPAEPLHDDR